MTKERAIEVLQTYVKWFDRPIEADRKILTDEMFDTTKFLKALDKAIQVMKEKAFEDISRNKHL